MLNVDIKETNLKFVRDLSERGTTDMIVIHHTGGSDIDASAEQIHSWHINKEWAGIGYHFVVRKDGTIERGRPEWAVGSHAYGENSHTIGIHLSGDFVTAYPTGAQVEKTAMLIAYLCKKYGIPIERSYIVGHGELMPTDCPGAHLQALLEDGTLTGKANWYLYGDAPQVPSTKEDIVKEEIELRFDEINELPEWAKPTIEKLVSKGLLAGDGASLDITLDMVRIFVVNDRAGLYG